MTQYPSPSGNLMRTVTYFNVSSSTHLLIGFARKTAGQAQESHHLYATLRLTLPSRMLAF